MFYTHETDDNDKVANVLDAVHLLEQINTKVKEAEEYARTNDLEFEFDYGYGARADYTRVEVSTLESLDIEYDKDSVTMVDDGWSDEEREMAYGWMSSTMYCM